MSYRINRYHYIDKKVGIKFEIFARKDEFADEIADRISKIGVYSLRRTKIFYRKQVFVETPPYELEVAQLEYVEEMEKNYIEFSKRNKKDCSN